MEKLLNTEEVAILLGVSRYTLEKWRSLGKGPSYVKLGAKVMYKPEDIEWWINQHRH